MLLVRSLLKTVFSRRDVKVFLSFIVLPLLVPLLSPIMDGTQGIAGQSFIGFLDLTLTSQYRLILPVLLMSLVVTAVFRDEIDSGLLFLYKDINRKGLFRAKIVALLTLYGVYGLGTLFCALMAYYALLLPQGAVTGALLPFQGEMAQPLLSLLATVLLNVVTIVLVVFVSLLSKTLPAVLSGVFFALLSTVAPLLTGVRYLFPTGYLGLAREQVGVALVMVLALSVLYFLVFYRLAVQRFQQVEF